MLIEIEQTYNPNVRNFYLSTPVLAAGKAEYADLDATKPSEFAREILDISGVLSVLVLPDMVCVRKKDEADFDFLAPQIMAQIVDYDFLEYRNFDFSIQDKRALIEALVEARIRPFLKNDGGDMEILGFENGILSVYLKGRCNGCPHADITLKNTVEAILKKYIFDVVCVQKEEKE